ncbi:unnamed protein product [Bemisia tabaci]|uniref:CTNNB1 binding N-teminal domain-containing protein n=1 Tax=Bemisia tabaci TaxID=7038 RepID=A0A9P0AAN3_BEMTA|nr:unnamed protein product [Bemisia tabaci]
MPHVSSGSGGDDLGSTDEVKVFKDEGEVEDEQRNSENLTEEKSSLIDLTESEDFSSELPAHLSSTLKPFISQGISQIDSKSLHFCEEFTIVCILDFSAVPDIYSLMFLGLKVYNVAETFSIK